MERETALFYLQQALEKLNEDPYPSEIDIKQLEDTIAWVKSKR